jgi:hypothetical protein
VGRYKRVVAGTNVGKRELESDVLEAMHEFHRLEMKGVVGLGGQEIGRDPVLGEACCLLQRTLVGKVLQSVPGGKPPQVAFIVVVDEPGEHPHRPPTDEGKPKVENGI